MLHLRPRFRCLSARQFRVCPPGAGRLGHAVTPQHLQAAWVPRRPEPLQPALAVGVAGQANGETHGAGGVLEVPLPRPCSPTCNPCGCALSGQGCGQGSAESCSLGVRGGQGQVAGILVWEAALPVLGKARPERRAVTLSFLHPFIPLLLHSFLPRPLCCLSRHTCPGWGASQALDLGVQRVCSGLCSPVGPVAEPPEPCLLLGEGY